MTIPSLNYSLTLNDAKNDFELEKKRKKTIGKITILKTFILSKFNDFGYIPSPSKFFIKVQFSTI